MIFLLIPRCSLLAARPISFLADRSRWHSHRFDFLYLARLKNVSSSSPITEHCQKSERRRERENIFLRSSLLSTRISVSQRSAQNFERRSNVITLQRDNLPVFRWQETYIEFFTTLEIVLMFNNYCNAIRFDYFYFLDLWTFFDKYISSWFACSLLDNRFQMFNSR